jgi:hypothetical protein
MEPLSECANKGADSNHQVAAGRVKPDDLRADVERSTTPSTTPGIAQTSDHLSDLRNKRC